MKKDLEIATECPIIPIADIAQSIGLTPDEIEPYGYSKAKVTLAAIKRLSNNRKGKLILVTGITPTSAGEGKTTTSVGLSQALKKCGKKAALALREPSLGPIFGIKGGATGGGYSQVIPMEEINLHFTGDLHAVTIAHNFLASMIDNSIHQGNPLQIDPRQIVFRRVVDLNDRSLRQIISGLGGKADGVPRETGFDITATSEVMAILCLASGISDLKKRLGEIVIGYTFEGKVVCAKDIKAEGAMTMLLKEAIKPNLVQTIEGVPAFIHGGPFANIAHGCNSLMATRLGLRVADYLVTEAGFATELGAEKFFNIKCRSGGLTPAAAVIVASIRALKMHGKSDKNNNMELLTTGLENLEKHIENINHFSVPVVVAINAFPGDTEDELKKVEELCLNLGAQVAISHVWEKGGEGGIELARKVIAAADQENHFKFLYTPTTPIYEKIELIATKLYGAKDINYSATAKQQIKTLIKNGYGELSICMAKTQKSISDDPKLLGRPRDFTLQIREVKLLAGAGFIVPITGNIMTMPGLPETPAAIQIDVDDQGNITGLF